MSKPKGSKTTKPNAYCGRAAKVKKKYGKNAYKKWGKLGGNPILLKGK